MFIKQKRALRWMMIAALNMGLVVLLGAFGAHGLRTIVDDSTLDIWETAVLYQFFHGVGLFLIGLISLTIQHKLQLIERHLQLIGVLFALGIIFFCGSLYGLVLSGVKILGIITPIGGAFFIMGWFLLFLALFRYYRNI
ncbi:DUF423 domain-containing protein [Thorsellia kenyensis]|uniref:DUF423 domain-containing protein n=1 Tax=Thorsellia kenyensis TaxID=1549888 RepID=A0ABV6CBS4_9GAMM